MRIQGLELKSKQDAKINNNKNFIKILRNRIKNYYYFFFHTILAY
jgi:hypothetical protein